MQSIISIKTQFDFMKIHWILTLKVPYGDNPYFFLLCFMVVKNLDVHQKLFFISIFYAVST